MAEIAHILENYKGIPKRVIHYNYPDYREIVIVNTFHSGTNGGRTEGEGATENNRITNIRRVKKNVKRYAFAHRLYTHLTITFAKNIQDVEYADDEFKKFMKRLEYNLAQNIKYVATREFQERGAIHYHILMDKPIWGNYFEHSEKFVKKYGNKNGHIKRWQGVNIIADIWGHGNAKIVEHSNNIKAINYIVKYIVKAIEDNKFVSTHGISKKAYLNSKGLKEGIQNMKKAVVFTNFTGNDMHNNLQEEKFEEMLCALLDSTNTIYNWTSPPEEEGLKITSILLEKE